MSKETSLREEIATARAKYHNERDNMTVKDATALEQAIAKMNQALSATITEGAKNCPKCNNVPLGMVRREDPALGYKIYEIGCLTCKPVKVMLDPDREQVTYQAANGASIEDTVKNWNDGKYRVRINAFVKQ